jgi:AcrR family transcriptional regulator
VYKSSREVSSIPDPSPKQRSKGEETKERIFQMALDYFNRNGIEYVGIRELARELGLSPGNVSYYFPTKDDLVLEITTRLSADNSKLFQTADDDLTLTSFIELFIAACHNHHKYRCVFTSFVHIMKHDPALHTGYVEIQRKRRASITRELQQLATNGYLKKDITKEEITSLVLVVSHLARFWIQDAEILMLDLPIDKAVNHYAGLIASTLHPYATAKGRQQLEPYVSNVIAKL